MINIRVNPLFSHINIAQDVQRWFLKKKGNLVNIVLQNAPDTSRQKKKVKENEPFYLSDYTQ